VTANVKVPTPLLAYWDNGSAYEPGDYTLCIGTSGNEIPLHATLKRAQE
jgi:beta-glucosidase